MFNAFLNRENGNNGVTVYMKIKTRTQYICHLIIAKNSLFSYSHQTHVHIKHVHRFQ